MSGWPVIPAQIMTPDELRQLTSDGGYVDLGDLFSIAFFLAVLTLLGVVPSLPGWIRQRRRRRRLQMLREERRIAQWYYRQARAARATVGFKLKRPWRQLEGNHRQPLEKQI